MSNSSGKEIQVSFTPEFKRNVRQLAKKYWHIKSDIQPVIDRLGSGQTPGDQVPRTHYTVFKVRIKNTDIKKGKRSGYCMIYSLKTRESVVLVTMYSKTEQGDISSDTMRRIISDFENIQTP